VVVAARCVAVVVAVFGGVVGAVWAVAAVVSAARRAMEESFTIIVIPV
jgi:hypothetical protein